MHRLPKAVCALGLTLAGACGGYTAPSGPSAPSSPPPTPADVSIVQGASQLTTTAFDPNPKALSLGAAAQVSVRWVNADGGGGYGGGSGVTHQIQSDDGAFTTSAPIGAGATYTVALTKAGTYHYHCAIHPNMVGTVTVGP
jgi:plastocyanin